MLRILLVCLLSSPVMAADLDVGIGYTKTEKPHDGFWFQEPFPHKIDRDSPSFHVGVRFKPFKNIRILSGVKYLGAFSTDAQASGSDANYYSYKDGESEIWPLSNFKGEGKAYGLYLKGQYDFRYFHVTAGYWLHKATWKVEIPDWRCATNTLGDCTYDYEGATYSDPQNLNVDNHSDYELGFIYGIGKVIGPFSLDFEILDTKSSGTYGAAYKGASQNISITYIY